MTTDWEYTCVHLARFGYPTRQAPLITVAALVALLWWYTIALAITTQDFDNPGTPYSVGQCVAPPNPLPTMMCCGRSGEFLRLASTFAPSQNTITFDRTDSGAFPQIIVGFDFRMTSSNGRADGLGFALLKTAVYGTTGAWCPVNLPFAAEEPNFSGSLGVGFDIHQNLTPPAPYPPDIDNNHISIHFGGTIVRQFPSPIDLAGGQWIHAQIIIRPGGGFSDVTVILTPAGGQPMTAVDRFRVPGLTPYEARAWFGAGSGSESADHDLDNIKVQFIDPAVVGTWSGAFASQVVAVHMNLLPTGQILYWEEGGYDHQDVLVDEIRLLDPITQTISMPALPPSDIFCSGHSFMADGRLLVTGGHAENDGMGAPNTSIYDPFANSWRSCEAMNAGRWYPTNITLGNGDVLVVSGVTSPDNLNILPQVWKPGGGACGSWRDLSLAQEAAPIDDVLYPRMFLMPDGKVFKASPTQDTWFLDTSSAGQWMPGPSSHFGLRSYGSAVMYDTGKVLIVGGGETPPTATAEVIDLNMSTPAWRTVAPMVFARRHLNTTLLPDGKVLVTNGTSSPGFNVATDAVLAAEIWDPATGSWSTMAAMQLPRVYHSTALLLPDARVLVGGGGRPASEPLGEFDDRTDFEIYSPPYLFKGPRPTITAAPTVVSHGQTFFVQTPDATQITHVNWIRLPSVTHAFDSNQRINRLSFSQVPGGLRVTTPASGNLSPLGHYMLFILNGDGVPSVARIIQIVPPALVVGLAEGGWLELVGPNPPHAHLGWRRVAWPEYNSINGETRPVLCDLDGDGKPELVLGFGSGGGGWLEIKSDADTGYAHRAWLQVQWPTYNGLNGETFPACGDLDGDGRAEIVVGLGRGGRGWVQAFDDAAMGFVPLPGTPFANGWIRLSWPAYNDDPTTGGQVRPAVGNLVNDAHAALVLGLGPYPGNGGWVQILDNAAAGFAPLPGTPTRGGWVRVNWPAYNTVNGETRPAVCDLRGDGKGELVLGLGPYPGNGGWVQILDNAAAGFAPLPGTPTAGGWVRVDWPAYNTDNGETFPTCGDLDDNGKVELVLGLGSYPVAGGWLEVRENLSQGLRHRSWARVPWDSYNITNGLTRPAVRP